MSGRSARTSYRTAVSLFILRSLYEVHNMNVYWVGVSVDPHVSYPDLLYGFRLNFTLDVCAESCQANFLFARTFLI